jgi:hypothetical protein
MARRPTANESATVISTSTARPTPTGVARRSGCRSCGDCDQASGPTPPTRFPRRPQEHAPPGGRCRLRWRRPAPTVDDARPSRRQPKPDDPPPMDLRAHHSGPELLTAARDKHRLRPAHDLAPRGLRRSVGRCPQRRPATVFARAAAGCRRPTLPDRVCRRASGGTLHHTRYPGSPRSACHPAQRAFRTAFWDLDAAYSRLAPPADPFRYGDRRLRFRFGP